jgi:hypothetical protein
MKSIKILVASIILAALAACGGQAKAQAIAWSQVIVSPTKTMDITSTRYVDLTPSAQTLTDEKGVTVPVVLVNNTAVTGSDAFHSYVQLSTYRYMNLRQTVSIECVGSNSVIDWKLTGVQTITDGCALSDLVKANSRR